MGAHKINFSEEELNDMIYMYRMNYSRQEIANKYNTSAKVVFNRTKNVLRAYEDELFLRNEYYNNKHNQREIAKICNCSEFSINKSFKKFGIKPLESISRKRKYTYNDNYFENIDDEHKAYWLGYIMADGCIRYVKNKTSEIRLTFCILRKDMKHLDKLCNDLNTNAKITECTTFLKDTQKYYQMATLKIYNKKIVEDLISHNCLPNKSLNEKIPNISKELYRHFIRGYFDGDGCFSWNIETLKSSFNIVSGYEILKFILKIINTELNLDNLSLCKDNSNDKLYYISYGNKNGIIKIMNWLYKDSTIYLDRKYDNYKTYLKHINDYKI